MGHKNFLETLGDSQLEDIIKRNGVIITPELATDELRARRRNRENPFEKFENKYYIYKNEDTIILIKTFVYSDEDCGLTTKVMKFDVHHGMIESDAILSISEEYLSKEKLTYYFKNFEETTADVWNNYESMYIKLIQVMLINLFRKE